MCHADTEICPHTRPHAHPGTPRQTQGQELLDTPTWGQGKRHAATAQGSSEGWDTPTGDQPLHRHRVTGRCSHTQQGGVAVTHTEKVTIACMHERRAIAHSHTLQKTLSTHRHTRARMSPVTQASSPCRDSRCHSVKRKRSCTSTHIYTTQQQVFSWTLTVAF